MKRIISFLLVVVLLLTVAPLAGLVGVDVGTKAEATNDDKYLSYYKDVISEYQDLIKNNYYRTKNGWEENEKYKYIPWFVQYCKYNENYFEKNYNTFKPSLYYAFYDIDRNGIPELLIGDLSEYGEMLFCVYTYANRKNYLLIESGERYSFCIYSNGTIVESSADGACSHYYFFYKIVNGFELEAAYIINCDTWDGTEKYYMWSNVKALETIDDIWDKKEQISATEANAISKKYTKANLLRSADKSDVKLNWKNFKDIANSNVIPAPTGLKVCATKATALSLTWDKVKGAAGYVVYLYNASTKKYTRLGTAKANAYQATGLKADKTYRFAVKAYKTANGKKTYSKYSNVLKASTAAAPAKVTGLKAGAVGTTSLKLTWSKVKGATGYVVYRYNASSKKYTKLGITAANSYQVKKLQSGATYRFAVRAYKKVNGQNLFGGYSAVLKVTTKKA